MNRLELESLIKEEGLKRGITITKCSIYDRGDYLDFYPEIRNDSAEGWVYKHQVTELIDDIAPVERPHKIAEVRIDREYDLFKIGDIVELDNIWIRLDAGEKEPKELIRVGAGCGQYRQGWVKGEVVETPAENDHALVIKFPRDIYIQGEKCGWIGHTDRLESLIRTGDISKVDAGQPVYCGTATWTVRKVTPQMKGR